MEKIAILPSGKTLSMFTTGGVVKMYVYPTVVDFENETNLMCYRIRTFWTDACKEAELNALRQQNAAQQQHITELEAQLNTRNLAVERDGDPLRENLNSLIQRYGYAVLAFAFAETPEGDREWGDHMRLVRQELEARLSTLVDIVRVLVRDNQNAFKDNRRYKAALEEVQRRVEGFVYSRNVSKRDLRQLYAHAAFALSGLLEGGVE